MAKPAFNLYSFCNKVKSTEKAVDYLQKVGVLCKSVNCSKCEKTIDVVRRQPGTNYFYFSCEDCKTVKSVRDHTIMANKHLGMRTLCLLVYMFVMCNGLTIAQKLQEVCSCIGTVRKII